MTTKKSENNDEILELLQESMQMTSDGFLRIENRMDGLDGRMDGLDSRMGALDSRMSRLETQYNELKQAVDAIAGEQKAQANDIKDILDRLFALEKRLPDVTELEIKEMQTKLQALIDWAVKSAKANKIPIILPR